MSMDFAPCCIEKMVCYMKTFGCFVHDLGLNLSKISFCTGIVEVKFTGGNVCSSIGACSALISL